MAKKAISKDIIRNIQKFKTVVEAAGVPVEKMILFGSYAKGTARTDSDIDVCVVSKKFGFNDVLEMQWLFKKTTDVDLRIEPYPMSPKDLKFTENPIVGEIVKWGVLV